MTGVTSVVTFGTAAGTAGATVADPFTREERNQTVWQRLRSELKRQGIVTDPNLDIATQRLHGYILRERADAETAARRAVRPPAGRDRTGWSMNYAGVIRYRVLEAHTGKGER